MLLDKLWKWVGIVAGAAAGVLYFLWRIAESEKDKAKIREHNERAKRKGVEEARDVEHDVDAAVNEARQEAEEVERENRERRRSGNRPERFGDRRLREEDRGR